MVIFFLTLALGIPFVINWFSRGMYGPLSVEFYVLVTILHSIRGISPTIYVLCWLLYKPLFKKLSKASILLFYLSLVLSCTFGSIYGNIITATSMTLFQLLWVTMTLPFVKVSIKCTKLFNRDDTELEDSTYCPVLNTYFISQNTIEDKNSTCSICLDKLHSAQKLMSTSCKHVYHSKCLLEWASKRPICPLCNNKLTSGTEV